MKNKLFDILGLTFVIYGLAMGFVLLTILIFESGVFVLTTNNIYSWYTLFIRPVPFMLLIWLSIIIMGRKKAYGQAHELYKIEIARLDKKIVDKDKQIANYILLDNVRIDKIKKYEKEITELKKDKVKSILVKPHITGPSLIIPFNQDDNTTEELVLCVCGKEMRECKTMYVCDWCKKRRKKEVE